MRKREMAVRASAMTAGVFLLVGVAGAALAAEVGDDDVDVNVTVTPLVEPGVLAMSVDGTSVTLVEETAADPLQRQFVGELPTVTVTDTRDPAEVPEGAFWYVVGTATDFTGTAGTIGAENLGWAPRLINGGDSGLVSEGDAVAPELAGGPGVVDQDLLAMAQDSATIAPEGTWTATADLTLLTPATVAAGGYTSVLTLSLFE